MTSNSVSVKALIIQRRKSKESIMTFVGKSNNPPIGHCRGTAPEVCSVFKKFGFESPDSSEGPHSKESPVGDFLEKIQAIFLDRIEGAPVSDNSTRGNWS